jgi:hypothetical protein
MAKHKHQKEKSEAKRMHEADAGVATGSSETGIAPRRRR